MNLGFHVIDSQRFTSGRGNESLIDIARIQVSDDRAFFIRISIELKAFATIEVWSQDALEWRELHTIPAPLVRPDIDGNLAALSDVGIAILKS